MAKKYAHIRKKAIELRTEKKLTLDEIVERLGVPKSTVFYWVKDIDIPYTEKQTEAQRRRAQQNSERYAKLREDAYQQGLEEAPELLKDLSLRDFVVLYMGEGTKKDRNKVGIVNSDPDIVRLSNRFITQFSANKIGYRLQYHADHDTDELCEYWGKLLEIDPTCIGLQRKSNSNEMSGRQWRSIHGLLTIETGDTYFHARLKAWMDFLKSQW